jgi:hypothetical protein
MRWRGIRIQDPGGNLNLDAEDKAAFDSFRKSIQFVN